ncbi:hypothetical protein Bca4012_086066 [Brassica carinata]
MLGIEGVIVVDHVVEMTETVREMMKPSNRDAHDTKPKPNFSKSELSFLLKLIPEYSKEESVDLDRVETKQDRSVRILLPSMLHKLYASLSLFLAFSCLSVLPLPSLFP